MNFLDTYINSIQAQGATTPALMSTDNIIHCLSEIIGQDFLSLEEVIQDTRSDIFFYDIPDDKKEFTIKIVREFIAKIWLAPYTGKHIYILRNFDHANISAQNAILKILEDCPKYAVIILEVTSIHNMLETVLSRTIHLVNSQYWYDLSDTSKKIIEYYQYNKKGDLLTELYWFKCSSQEAIALLRSIYPHTRGSSTQLCQYCIESLATTYENPRNILDAFFV